MIDKTKKFDWDEWTHWLQERRGKGDYDLDAIVKQLEAGDFSSLDQELVRDTKKLQAIFEDVEKMKGAVEAIIKSKKRRPPHLEKETGSA